MQMNTDMRAVAITKNSTITSKMLQLLQYFAITLAARVQLLVLICVNSYTVYAVPIQR